MKIILKNLKYAIPLCCEVVSPQRRVLAVKLTTHPNRITLDNPACDSVRVVGLSISVTARRIQFTRARDYLFSTRVSMSGRLRTPAASQIMVTPLIPPQARRYYQSNCYASGERMELGRGWRNERRGCPFFFFSSTRYRYAAGRTR